MEVPEKIARLRALAFLRHVPDASLEALARVLGVRRVPAGDPVFEEGSAGDAMFLLIEGEVRIEKRVEAGDAKVLGLLAAGEVFGEMALIEEAPRSARVVAQTDVACFVLGRADLDRWLRSDARAAVGFFVELTRVLSHRVRLMSEHVVLLHDLGQLLLQRVEDEAVFLQAALHRLLSHLEGDWSGAAYLTNDFNEEVARAGAEGPDAAALPPPPPPAIGGPGVCWLDAATLRVPLPGRADRPLGALDLRSATAPGPRERRELETTLEAAAHLLGSALQHIRHDTEERLRARLEHRRASWSAP